MNRTAHKELLAYFDEEFPKDTLAPGEAFLTLPQFHALLKATGHKFSRAVLYRWTKVPKEGLPTTVQDMLKPAPSVWLLTTPSRTSQDRWDTRIPLRYITPSAHSLAFALIRRNTLYPTIMTSLQSLQSSLTTMNRELQELINLHTCLSRKDATHAEH